MKVKTKTKTLNPDLLRKLDTNRREANCLCGKWLGRVGVLGRSA